MICSKCGVDKDLNEFYDIKHSKLCKECFKQRQREYHKANKQSCNKASRMYYKNHKDKHKDYWFKKRYGISLEEYDRILEEQNGVCAICACLESDNKKDLLSVDHDHETGQIRGLLCSNCNRGLGSFKDSLDLLDKAVDYLERNKDGL